VRLVPSGWAQAGVESRPRAAQDGRVGEASLGPEGKPPGVAAAGPSGAAWDEQHWQVGQPGTHGEPG